MVYQSILKSLKPVIDYLIQVGATEQIGYNAKYIFEIMDSSYIDQAIHQIQTLLPSNLSGEIMTIAEQLRQQGIQAEKFEIAKSMLAKGIDIKTTSEVTKLPIEEIKQIKKGETKH